MPATTIYSIIDAQKKVFDVPGSALMNVQHPLRGLRQDLDLMSSARIHPVCLTLVVNWWCSPAISNPGRLMPRVGSTTFAEMEPRTFFKQLDYCKLGPPLVTTHTRKTVPRLRARHQGGLGLSDPSFLVPPSSDFGSRSTEEKAGRNLKAPLPPSRPVSVRDLAIQPTARQRTCSCDHCRGIWIIDDIHNRTRVDPDLLKATLRLFLLRCPVQSASSPGRWAKWAGRFLLE